MPIVPIVRGAGAFPISLIALQVAVAVAVAVAAGSFKTVAITVALPPLMRPRPMLAISVPVAVPVAVPVPVIAAGIPVAPLPSRRAPRAPAYARPRPLPPSVLGALLPSPHPLLGGLVIAVLSVPARPWPPFVVAIPTTATLWGVPRGKPCLLFLFSFCKNLSELILMEQLTLAWTGHFSHQVLY